MAVNKTSEKADLAKQYIEEARREIGLRIVGQKSFVDGLLMGMIAGGHVLVEGVPGLAKTMTVRTLSDVIGADFKRIQFTPDLLPADLIGTMIFQQQTGEFVPRKGPVFSHIVLADEINRAPAKVQSALLESMAEKQVTIGNKSYALPDPFFVLATQNPIEQEGTYQLPEAQLDRFLLKLKVGYPEPEEELEILNRRENPEGDSLKSVLTLENLQFLKQQAETVKVDEKIRKYIVSLVSASRAQDKKHLGFVRYIEYGASPRASLGLYSCSRVKAMMEGRSFVLPEDVKAVAPRILRHRIVLSYEAEAEERSADDVIYELLNSVAVP